MCSQSGTSRLEGSRSSRIPNRPTNQFDTGVDELNLAEFPLASISDRISDGKKTVVFEDEIFDREEGRTVARRLTLSGSDRYGLPTAKDDDVLLACIQISKLEEFRSPEVNFSRYEILKLLRWPDDNKNYQRIAHSLRRWKGLTIYSDRAFYDHAAKSWVNRDFSVFDKLVIYRIEPGLGVRAKAHSSFTWNEVIFKSFQAGYLKRLDWSLYTRLESPIAKRLYRFLDKRFYHGNTVEIDLHELALLKVRLSPNYNTAQMKRVLTSGIAELESQWDLRPLSSNKLFRKEGKGNWIVRFERKVKRPGIPTPTQSAIPTTTSQPIDLQFALTKRGCGPALAEELTQSYPATSIQTMLELFDWYNNRGQSRGPGFLVQSIKNPASIQFPKGFESSEQILARKTAEKNRIALQRNFQTRRERKHSQREESRQQAFTSFWQSLSPTQQEDFERQALDQAAPTKRAGYSRTQSTGGQVFEHYRTIILRDHFERTHQSPSL